MTGNVRFISNPLTIIAIFAALAEVNATVSIGLVNSGLQQIFIWFVIAFPILLVLLFFITLNFNTKVIYAPSDYKADESFQKMFLREAVPDKEINFDKDIISRTIKELRLNQPVNNSLNTSKDVIFLFNVRYNIEKELRRITSNFLDEDQRRNKTPLMMLSLLTERRYISPEQLRVIRNLYSIATPVIHGDENRLTLAEINFAKSIAPGIVEELRKIN